MTLQGKTAIVTGGGTGIGLGIAEALADEGCRVAITGRREEPLRAAVAARATEPALLYHTVDVAAREDVGRLFEWAADELGTIDILVHSAGTNIKTRSMADMRPEQWDEVLAINTTGVYNCIYAVLPQMRERGDGLIIIINSIAGLRANPLGGVAYNASKFAATALGTAVGNEEGGAGIRVTSVHPGEVDTPLLDKRPVLVSDEHRATMLQPEDLGALAVMLACLPPRAHIPEVIIKPTSHGYV